MKYWIVIISLFLPIFQAKATSAQLRVVALTANWAHTVAAVGALDLLVGATEYAIYPETIPQRMEQGQIEEIKGYIEIDLQQVKALKPDLILTATDLQKPMAAELREMGYAVLHMESARLVQIYQAISALGEQLQRRAQAQALNENIQEKIRQLQHYVPQQSPIKTYYEINYLYKCVPGKDSYMSELIELAGGDPIYDERAGYSPVVTWQEVVAADPEVILLPFWEGASTTPIFEGLDAGNGTTNFAEVKARVQAMEIDAVTENAIYYIDSALTKQPGPNIPAALEILIETIHQIEIPDQVIQ